MEGEQTALDGQPDGQDSDGQGNDRYIGRIRSQLRQGRLHVHHQQMARNVVEQDNAQQEKT